VARYPDQDLCSYHGSGLASKSPDAIRSLLQESSGALYQLGVADDGTLVGLEEKELEDSIEYLRSIAATVGAYVTVTRKVFVKTVDQKDVDHARSKLAEHLIARAKGKSRGRKKMMKDAAELLESDMDCVEAERFHIPHLGTDLFVAEALVKPCDGTNGPDGTGTLKSLEAESNSTEQLRISLTGPTMSGKTTLLGTLTNGDLDNGRGKNRLSLLKHRHELASGVTSSVTCSIIGYKPEASGAAEEDSDDDCGFFGGGSDEPEPADVTSRVVNYSTGNISSWIDIHSASEGGRIVFVSDSAGHLKFRRTTVRSLVGWAPHYVALMIPADDCESREGAPGLSEDSLVHIDLCLKLEVPLMVIFTKIDVASKQHFRSVFSGILGILKKHGKRPLTIASSAKIQEAADSVAKDPIGAVPIIFTSSVRGDGIDLVHELFIKLPMPAFPVLSTPLHPLPNTSLASITSGLSNLTILDNGKEIPSITAADNPHDEAPDTSLTTLFHVEEIFGLKPISGSDPSTGGSVISGHVRYGHISMGDKLMVGPFHSGSEIYHRSRSATPTPTPNATPVVSSYLSDKGMSKSPDGSGDEREGDKSPNRRGRQQCWEPEDEWRLAKVVSVRRLRLPVTTLFAGEAGTIGVVPVDEEDEAKTDGFDSINCSSSSSNGTDGGLAAITTSNSPQLGTSPRPIEKAVTFASPASPEPEELRLKKGHVLLNRSSSGGKELWMKAYTGFYACLNEEEAAAESLVVGSDVIVYIASVRAVARIVAVERSSNERANGNGEGLFGCDDCGDGDEGDVTRDTEAGGRKQQARRFKFEFNIGLEWLELGAKVLVMKNQGLQAGMEVFVGNVMGRVREREW
jgi:GTPase